MSFTNKTPNLGLPQWIDTDEPTYLVDQNNAYAEIDKYAGQVNTFMSNSNTLTEGIVATQNSHTEKLTEQAANISENSEKINTLDAQQKVNTSHLADLDDSVKNLNAGLETETNTNADKFTQVNQTIQGIQTNVAEIENDKNQLQAQVQTLDTNVQNVNTNITQLSNNYTELSGSVATNTGNISKLNEDVSNLTDIVPKGWLRVTMNTSSDFSLSGHIQPSAGHPVIITITNNSTTSGMVCFKIVMKVKAYSTTSGNTQFNEVLIHSADTFAIAQSNYFRGDVISSGEEGVPITICGICYMPSRGTEKVLVSFTSNLDKIVNLEAIFSRIFTDAN